MSSDDTCFICGWTGNFGIQCHDAQCYLCDEFGHFAQDCLHKIPLSGTSCYHGRSHSRQQYTHNWRDRSHSYYVPRHRRHYRRSQSSPIHTMIEAAALKGTPHALLPANTAVYTAPQPMDVPITPHTIWLTGLVASHSTHATSSVGTTHSTPLTEASLTSAAPTM